MNNETQEEKNVSSHNNDPAREKLQNLSRRGFNAATGGTWNRVHNAPVIGKAAKKAEDKAAEKLGNNRLVQKIANKTNHQRPELGAQTSEEKTKSSNKENDDVGSRNLQKSLKDKTNKMWQNRKKKKEEKKKESETDSSNNEEENNDESASSVMDDMVAKGKRRLKIKIIIYSVIIGVFLLMFASIFMAIFGVDISATIPAINQGAYGTDKFSSTYEEGTKEYQDEIAYYEKIKTVNEEYAKEHSEEIKTTYIHAALIYYYYQIDDNNENNYSDNISVDYGKMTGMIDTIVTLMTPSDTAKNIDYEKNGEFYNNLKNSNEFKDYYKDVLKTKNINDLLDEIFDLALELDEIEKEDSTVITSETQVMIATTGSETTPKKVTINEYLADSIYAKTSSVTNTELVKAYTIAYSTNIAAQNKNLTIDSNSASMNNMVCSTKLGCSYDANGNLVDGPGVQSEKNTNFYNGGYYYKTPLSSEDESALNKAVTSVFGNVLVKSDGTYPNLDISKISGLGDGDYKSILSTSYGDYTIKNIGENSYILDASYGETKVYTDVKFYDQGNYSGNSFCGLKKETIASSGCGITSMAMVVSTYENSSKYDPLWTNDIAKSNGQCGSGRGTDYSHFKYVAKKMGYKTPVFYVKSKANSWKLSKSSYNNILKNLAKGNLIIVHVGKGHFTRGGHYMVLGGIDPETKKVYVFDPNNKSNSKYRKTGNGWYSFNDIIAPESVAFIIFEKKG